MPALHISNFRERRTLNVLCSATVRDRACSFAFGHLVFRHFAFGRGKTEASVVPARRNEILLNLRRRKTG